MSSSFELEENENNSKNEEENNPFSFKNFLQHSNQNNDEDQLNQLPELDSLPSPTSHIPTNLISSVDDLTATSLIPDLPLPGDDDLRLAHQKIEQQQRHIVKLERQIKILIRKEETDNNQLELVIRQVEKNLKETTERALESEKCCNLLKLDVVKLNEEMNVKNVENKLLRKQIDLLTNKLSSVSNRLTQATKLAKTNLITMMSGVDELTRDLNNINVFMQSFKTNDKISETLDSNVEIDINAKIDENENDDK